MALSDCSTQKGADMAQHNLELTLQTESGDRALAFPARRLVCSGWVGRDKAALQAHIDELAELGIEGPTRTPIYMNFPTYLVTTADTVEVISAESSGEVEYVVLRDGASTCIGVGSDHTDRGFERHSIPASKLMYPKVMASAVWPLEEVAEHWDRLVIRSWVTAGGKRQLYQEDELAAILDMAAVLAPMPPEDGPADEGLVLFSGTVATKQGMVYGERFDFELEDPLRGRKLSHGYDVRVLAQHT
jgi:hypothetical protein